MNRRQFVTGVAGLLAAGMIETPSILHAATDGPGMSCIAFDALAIFDVRPIAAMADHLFGERGKELFTAWRSRQFEYTWLRTAAAQYVDFLSVTRDALRFAARSMKIDLSDAQQKQLMDGFLNLNAYAEAPAALRSLKQSGVRMAFCSNFTPAMLAGGIHTAGLDGLFEHSLSTDAVRQFKPAPAAYQMAIDAFSVPKERILFVPSAAWDAAGAKWFGYRTFWVNRQGLPAEELGATADGEGRDLTELAAFLK